MKKYAVAVLTILTFVTVVEFSIVMPLGPQIADQYGISRNSVTLLFVGHSIMGLLVPIIGYLADKYGLKKFILLSVFFFTIGTFIISVSLTSVGYFIGRSIIGLGFYAITSLVIVYSSKIISYDHLGIVSGIYKFSFAASMFAAPIIGSFFISKYDIATLYLTLSISSVVLLIMLLPLKEILGDNEIHLTDVKNMIRKKEVLLMIIATFMLSVPSVFFFNYLSTHLQEIGYSVERASTMFSIIASGSILTSIVILVSSDKIGKLRMAKAGVIISAVSLLGFLFNVDLIIIIAGVVFGIGYDTIWGLFFPVASKMYKVGVNSYIAILSMSMALASVVTNLVAPIVMDSWSFTGNLLISFVALVICYFSFVKGTKPFEKILN